MPIRLMLVDDHPVVRDGLHGVFAADEDFEVVAEAGDGQEALARAARVEVDVVLLDLRMPRMGGVETIRALARQAPDVRVLVLTTFDTDRDVLPAIEAGATGYLLKDASAAELKAAVRAAYAGQPVLAPSVAGRLIGQVRRGPDSALSPREVEILRLVAAGTTNRETPSVAHQRGHRQDAPAAPLREARRQRPGGRRERGLPARPAVLTHENPAAGRPGSRWCREVSDGTRTAPHPAVEDDEERSDDGADEDPDPGDPAVVVVVAEEEIEAPPDDEVRHNADEDGDDQ
jgi:DNA-binding NarL/FixJ family response regulator